MKRTWWLWASSRRVSASLSSVSAPQWSQSLWRAQKHFKTHTHTHRWGADRERARVCMTEREREKERVYESERERESEGVSMRCSYQLSHEGAEIQPVCLQRRTPGRNRPPPPGWSRRQRSRGRWRAVPARWAARSCAPGPAGSVSPRPWRWTASGALWPAPGVREITRVGHLGLHTDAKIRSFLDLAI